MKPRRLWRASGAAALGFAAVVAFATPAAAAESTTTVEAVPSSATVGQQIALNATVSCPNDPSGGLGVTFVAGTEDLGTYPVDSSGQASTTTSFSSPGDYEITAVYAGTGVGEEQCAASFATTTVQVSQSTTPPGNSNPTPPGSNGNRGCGCENIYAPITFGNRF